MATTLYINPLTRDLDVDANGNIAVATGPYQLAQDAASAIKTVLGEVYYDKSLGITGILGESPTLVFLKAQLVAAAMSVAGVASATVYIMGMANRTVTGQVQISDAAGAQSAASF